MIAALALSACGASNTSEATGSNPGDGKQIFTDVGCASCHSFQPAGSAGGSGPDLNNTSLTTAEIEEQIKNGGGGMPSYSGDLTDAQISAVSAFIEGEGSSGQ